MKGKGQVYPLKRTKIPLLKWQGDLLLLLLHRVNWFT